ncbi:MAG: aminoacyl-tRNA hydrolase [Candidatus Paceibacterota bacterium]
MYIIAGLGNPGDNYEGTRHNVGWFIVDELANGRGWTASKYAHASLKEENRGGEQVIYAKPTTYMNKSGESLAYLRKKNDVSPENIIVLHDDVDLPLGTFKISFDRGAGGHNGVKSIINHLKTKEFVRIRVGIAPTTLRAKLQQKTKSLSGYVLTRFWDKEREELKLLIPQIGNAVDMIISDGVEKAMNRFN